MALTIDPTLQSLIPPLTPEEYRQLEDNIRADGCRDPLIIWAEQHVLLDGHHRLQICEQHGIDYHLQELSLPDFAAAKAWMITNQLGRRNLTPDQMIYYRGEQYNLQKQRHGGDRKSEISSTQNGNLKTVDRLAAEHGVSRNTIARDGAYATAVETVATVVGPDARQAIRDGNLQLTRQDVSLLASLVNQSPETVQAVKDALTGPAPAATLKAILTEVQDPEPPATASSTLEKTSTGDYEWYTPEVVLAAVRKVLGQIDVDPASCDVAQARVQARIFYDLAHNGLNHPWHGTVYLNPPYLHKEITPFIAKLFHELDAGHTTAAILVVHNRTETDWFQSVALRADAVCFPDGRIPFHHATKDGMQPCSGHAICYFGPQVDRFAAVFVELGVIMQAMRGVAPAQLALAATSPAPVPQPEPAPSAAEERPPDPAAPVIPPYDPATYRLGKLCPQRHEWGQTGLTRRNRKGGYCPDCHAEKRREASHKERVHGD